MTERNTQEIPQENEGEPGIYKNSLFDSEMMHINKEERGDGPSDSNSLNKISGPLSFPRKLQS